MRYAPNAGLVVRLEVESPVVHAVDLVVVGVVEPRTGEPLRGAILALDQLLDGAIKQTRAGGSRRGRLGERRLIATPRGITAPRVLLVGLGQAETFQSKTLTKAGRVAVEEAFKVGASKVGFAPGLRDAGVTSLGAREVAQAVVLGVRQCFAEKAARSKRSLVFALEVSAEHFQEALDGLK